MMKIENNKEYNVHVLASGSKGNATLVEYGDDKFLIDAGISCRRLVAGMAALNISPEELKGVCITHEHSDHISGLPQLLKRFNLPVYTKEKTWKAMGDKVSAYDSCFEPIEKHFELGKVSIESFSISHDAIDPIGFACYVEDKKLTLVTDTGFISNEIMSYINESNFLVIESNYDLEMLKYGPYIASLKRRVAGPYGHLSNTDTAKTLLNMKRPDNMQVILAHRSEKNNTVKAINKTMVQELSCAGLKVGKDLTIFHGQPDRTVSMKERA